MTIRGLLFDKDGTLFDFDATWTRWAGDALRELGSGDEGRTQAMADALGYDLEKARFHPGSSVIAGTVGEQAMALAPFLPEMDVAAITRRINVLAASAVQVEVLPLRPFLETWKEQGVALGVATNDAESSARAHLESVQALDVFDFLAGYDSGHGHKPGPGQLLAFTDATGIEPARIAMVGDSTHDLMAARAAGMVAVAVLTGPADAEALAPYADVVLSSIAELPGWVATSARR
ncbi:MAG: HAD family hydrolase [Pseudomonadota bacterium]